MIRKLFKKPLVLSIFLFCSFMSLAQTDRTTNFPMSREVVNKMPDKKNVWIFIMAGQSNMAGRGFVEPGDTISNKRIIALDRDYHWTYAKEPLNCYEPSYVGLDCGLSFGRSLIEKLDDSITVALVHCAVGGSSIGQWLGDSLHRDVYLQKNLKSRISYVKQFGTIKGILWHQGESDAHPGKIESYEKNLENFIHQVRILVGNNNLPFFIASLADYAIDEEPMRYWKRINQAIWHVATRDRQVRVIYTQDLKDRGDHLHFDSESQREMGRRFAQKCLEQAGFESGK